MSNNKQDLPSKLAKARQQLAAAQARVAKLEAALAQEQPPSATFNEDGARYRRTLDHMLEGCQIIGFDWRYLYLNDTAARYGRQPKEELLGRTVMERYPGFETTEMYAVLRRCMEERTAQDQEFEFTYPDGLKAWFEFRIQPVPEGIFILTLDITERKRAEEHIRKLYRTLTVLSGVNQSIVRIRHLPTLFEKTCRIAVEQGGFRMAWIGMLDAQTRRVKPVARTGIAEDYLEKLDIRLDDPSRGQGPTASAILSGEPVVCGDIEHDPRMAPSRADALQLGYRASAALPFKVRGEVCGTINLYASEPYFFDDEELRLLGEMAMDLSFAMEFAEQEAQRQQAEKELEALYNATSYLFKSDSLLNLGHQIVEAVIREFEHTDCGLMLVAREQNNLIRLARVGEYNIQPDTPLTLDGPGLVPLAVRSGKTVYAPDVTRDPHYLCSEARTRSELVIPLRTASGIIGVLDLQSDKVNAFSERDQRILTAFAERAAAAIEIMQLYEALNQHAAELEWRVAQRTAELEAAKDRVEAILNSSTDGILLVHDDLSIRQTNPAFDRLFASEPDDYFGESLTALVHPDDADAVNQLTQMATTHIEARARRKDGTPFDAELSLGHIKDNGWVCTIRDITKRKQAEAALKESEARYRIISELISDYAYAYKVNPDGSIYPTWTTEEAFHRLTGFMPDELHDFALYHPAEVERAQRDVERTIQGQATDGEYRIITKGGEVRWIHIRRQVEWDETGQRVTALYGAGQDITQRKRYEEMLEYALKQEKELNELKSRFVSMASHEFRTPLATILALTETLNAYRHKMDDAQIAQRLDKIHQQVDHLTEIMDDVLELARLQARRYQFNPVSLNLDLLCQNVIDEFQSRPDITHQLVYSCNDSLREVKLDKKLMRQSREQSRVQCRQVLSRWQGNYCQSGIYERRAGFAGA